MRCSVSASTALLIAPLLCAGAAAQTPDQYARGLLDWIAVHYPEYELGVPVPEIEFRSPEQLAIDFHGPARVARAEFDPDLNLQTIAGMYEPETRQLALSSTLVVGSGEFLAVLVHELVHHHQAVAGNEYPCLGLSEPEAFSIENDWRELFYPELEPAAILDGLMAAQTCELQYYE